MSSNGQCNAAYYVTVHTCATIMCSGTLYAMSIHVHTDGGCWGNPGPGGWACIVTDEERRTILRGGEAHTTNNRMELTAVIKALQYIRDNDEWHTTSVEVYTDSQYVQRGITQWIRTWKKNGWKTSGKKPVKNQDLWRLLDRLTQEVLTRWHWIKGHAGIPENEECDALVQQSIGEIGGT
jgi:ribonuclease HI